MNAVQEGERLATRGSKLAYDHAAESWKHAALTAIVQLARVRAVFTADDVWELLEERGEYTPEPRALGVVVRKAVGLGIIRLTGRYVKSIRPVCHRKPTQVYESLRLEAEGA